MKIAPVRSLLLTAPMTVSLQHEHGNLYRIDLTGLLRRTDFANCEAALIEEMRRGGSVKLLFVLTDFEGWDAHADWNDLTFYVKHGGQIERIAIVADPHWRSQALLFAAAGLRRAPVEFFPRGDLAGAHAWLSA